MMDTEIRHDRIERPVGIGQRFGLALVEAKVWVRPARLGEHGG